jgi:hypothetical protein
MIAKLRQQQGSGDYAHTNNPTQDSVEISSTISSLLFRIYLRGPVSSIFYSGGTGFKSVSGDWLC